jgi:hypothetical protein
MKLRSLVAVVSWMLILGLCSGAPLATAMPAHAPTFQATPSPGALGMDDSASTSSDGSDSWQPGEADTSWYEADEIWTTDEADTSGYEEDRTWTPGEADTWESADEADTAWVESSSGNLVVNAPGTMESRVFPIFTELGLKQINIGMAQDTARLYVTEVVPTEAASASTLSGQFEEVLATTGIDYTLADQRDFQFKGHRVSEVVYEVNGVAAAAKLTCWMIVEDGHTYVLAVFDLDPDGGGEATARFLESLEITSPRREI